MTMHKYLSQRKSLVSPAVGLLSGLLSGTIIFFKLCEWLSISLNGSSDEIWIILVGIVFPAVFGCVIGFVSQHILLSMVIPVMFSFTTNVIWLIICVIVGIIFAIINHPESMLFVALLAGLCSVPVAGFFLVFIE